MGYKVLWLDSGFAKFTSPSSNLTSGLYSGFELAKTFNLDIDTANNYPSFKSKLQDGCYQATIIEVFNLNPNDENDFSLAYQSFDLATRAEGVLTYIFSRDANDARVIPFLYNLKEKGRCFNKDDGFEELYKKINDDLEHKLYYYKGHEKCLEIFEWIPEDKHYIVRSCMDDILEQYIKDSSNLKKRHYNDIRSIMTVMVEKLADICVFPQFGDNESDDKTFNKRIECLTEKCHYKIDHEGKIIRKNIYKKEGIIPLKTPDFDKPIVPFKICDLSVKKTIKFLADICSINSHPLVDRDCPYVNRSVCFAFFAVIDWFCNFMTQYEQHGENIFEMYNNINNSNVIPFAPLEHNDKINVYHCGSYMVREKDVDKGGLKEKVGELFDIFNWVPSKEGGEYPRIAITLVPHNYMSIN